MEILKKLWNWLNGNKTFFGLIILAALQQGLIPEHTFAHEVLTWLAGLLTTGGVLHKLAKANTKPEPNK